MTKPEEGCRSAFNDSSRARLPWLDSLRGLIMVLMALDHAAFFIAGQHPSEIWSRPLPEYQALLPFLTRYVTHLCAPGFLFLMGAGMVFLAESRQTAGWSRSALVRHFALRGALLILLQLLLVDPAWIWPSLVLQAGHTGQGAGFIVYIGVLFALGGSMILCGPLIELRAGTIFLIGCAAVLLSQLLVPPPGLVDGLPSQLVSLLWLPGLAEPLYVNYPILPWFGLACFGMVLAKLQGRQSRLRRQLSLYPGLICLGLFAAVRGLGGFGNFHPPAGSDWMAFLNVTKYPPSLAFLLISLGGNLLLVFLLSRLERPLERTGTWLKDFGRAPLFFYVSHLYLYGLLSLFYPDKTSLAGMYPLWALGLVILLPACRRYARFKAASRPGSVWRLF